MAQFLIAGAGMAGLTAALALARDGHAVTIAEQASALSEVGAGLQLGPNAMRILRQLGLESALRDVAYEPLRLVIRDARDDRVLSERALNEHASAQQAYGAPHLCIHRADLQNTLRQAAQAQGVTLRLQQTIQDVHDAMWQGGSWDALLGCDGLHSQVRQALLARTVHGGPAQRTGHIAYRALLDVALLPPHLQNPSVQVWLGAQQHVVAYRVNTKQLNLVIVQEGACSTCEPEASGLSAHLHALIQAAQTQGGFKTWELFQRAPMLGARFYANERVALLGDAAHPMLPYLAQGAAMAIEDAYALAAAVATQPTTAQALRTYAQVRWRRNARVQLHSRLQGLVFHARGVVRLARNLALRHAGERLSAMSWLYDEAHSTQRSKTQKDDK